MCLIVDINALHLCFDVDAGEHQSFAPIRNWLFNGSGKFVYGGSKYKSELAKSGYLRILAELNRSGSTVPIDDLKVDTKQQELEKKYRKKGYDDAHIVSISLVSGCKVICTKDSGLMSFVKEKEIFSSNRPKIYSGLRNKALISNTKYWSKCCD